MAISAIAASQPSFTAQSIAGRRSTLESLLGGLGSFRTALRSLGILGDSAPSLAPVSPEGSGTAGLATTALLLAPPSATAPEPVDAAPLESVGASTAVPSSAPAAGSASPSAYTAAGAPVYRLPTTATFLDLTV